MLRQLHDLHQCRDNGEQFDHVRTILYRETLKIGLQSIVYEYGVQLSNYFFIYIEPVTLVTEVLQSTIFIIEKI
jgi:hypothetical protein